MQSSPKIFPSIHQTTPGLASSFPAKYSMVPRRLLKLPAVVMSVEYRLAPEHRHPEAYDDAMEALHWIKCNQEEWLREYADFSNCFLMGTSAGGNITYHVTLRAAEAVNELEPLQIRGMILNHPFFGGIHRTGSDRDHKYCNLAVEGGSKFLEKVRAVGWRVLVNGCEGDPLVDRRKEVLKLMEENGVEVIGRFVTGGVHAAEMFDSSWAKALHAMLKDFSFLLEGDRLVMLIK
ncbi:hypothetical protein SLEP1_g3629 [Rubroshorea leprosula]|uniref:Alpha/beta hydrolase fold-3 domain-containing protein n=1 Tax=Rubroshorea leprosula TaxID=152421 RepID=A0AAV5HWV1_9ROSI|nr:hypothetical protein SLEP1_g3629 [Rubroshorea leprosula]